MYAQVVISTIISARHPTGVAVDMTGNVYVVNRSDNYIRKVNPAGNATIIVGNDTRRLC